MVCALNTLLFVALHTYIVRHLIKPGLAPLQDPRGTLKAMSGPVSYLVGAAAWFSVHTVFVVHALTPLLYIRPTKWHGLAAK
jgi:hypothetical protein